MKNTKTKLARSYRELEVYKTAFRFQQNLFKTSKSFPAEERYSLTDQGRRTFEDDHAI